MKALFFNGSPRKDWTTVKMLDSAMRGAAECHYPEIFGENERFLKQRFGYTETLCTYNSYQFSDYSRYDIVEGAQEWRAKYRDEQFPRDLEAAYELGKRLADHLHAAGEVRSAHDGGTVCERGNVGIGKSVYPKLRYI